MTNDNDVYLELEKRLTTNEFLHGTKLRAEILRAEFGCSASTVREVLFRLATQGLVDFKEQRGFRVPDLSPKKLIELTHLRVMLEEEGFDYMPLAGSVMRNVAAPSLLDAMSAPRTLADLRRFHQVIARDSGQASGLFDRELGVQKGQRRWYVSDLHMKKQLLVAGLGWGRLPTYL